MVVVGAVLASMGFLALLGLPSSLIIVEVVPFLVLAVGADNIFIFVQELQVGAAWGQGTWGVWGAPLSVGVPMGHWGTFGDKGPHGHLWVLGSPRGTGDIFRDRAPMGHRGTRTPLGTGDPVGHGVIFGDGVPMGHLWV